MLQIGPAVDFFLPVVEVTPRAFRPETDVTIELGLGPTRPMRPLDVVSIGNLESS